MAQIVEPGLGLRSHPVLAGEDLADALVGHADELADVANWEAFLAEQLCHFFLDSPRGRARVGSSSLPGPALVLVREKGSVIAPQSVLALWFSS